MSNSRMAASLATAAAGFVGNKLVNKAWEKGTGQNVPEDPADPEVRLAKALGWAVFSSAVVAVLQVVIGRAAQKAAQKVAPSEEADKDRLKL